jgi:hypothetical protein
MATQTVLPAPLRLRPAQTTSLSLAEASSSLQDFLSSDSSSLLVGSGVVRASLVRLLQGLKDDLDHPVKKEDSIISSKVNGGAEDGEKKKKRRKSDAKGADGEGKKKKRKTEA